MKSKDILKSFKHKSIIFLIIASLLLSSLSLIPLGFACKSPQIQEDITVDTAYYMIKHERKYPDLIIIDVRDTLEFNLGHLYDAILIPLDVLELKITELEGYKNSEIIIYCKTGYKSSLAREVLVEKGLVKVHNMLGGILAWIEADYPIWTTSHKIAVNKNIDNKVNFQIEPLLLYYSGSSCGCENDECSSQSESIGSISYEVIEQGEDQKKVLLTYELKGIIYEYIITTTIIWSYNKITSKFNKSAYFILKEITSDDFYLQFYQLDYFIYHEDYKLTIHTQLDPLNSDTYNSASTAIIYVPTSSKTVNSLEVITINIPLKLSQHYWFLARITKKLAKLYKKSEDPNLKTLYYSYINIKKGILSLSKLVKNQLFEFDNQILESYGFLEDYIPEPIPPPPPPPPPPEGCFGGDPEGDCIWCELFCMVIIVSGCLVGCYYYLPACPYCLEVMYYVEVLHVSCYVACVLFGCCE